MVEKEKVHHTPGTTGAGVGTGATHATTGMAGAQGPTGVTTDREMAVGQERQSAAQGATQHGKPTMLDKIIGIFR